MRLYSGISDEFVRETTHNRIADRLADAFFDYYRYRPSRGEISSWRNSLRAMSLIVQDAELYEQGVILEYQLPQSSQRLDCMLCGRDARGIDQAIIVELKQWEECTRSDAKRLLTWVGGGMRDVLHPAVQVGQYHQYLQDTHTAFQRDGGNVELNACAYLHNYKTDAADPLLDAKFAEVISTYPVFDSSQAAALSGYLSDALGAGDGRRVLQKIEESKYRPSKKLMEQLSGAIRKHSPWVLLDEQLVVYEKIRALAAKGLNDSRKRVVIVKGGPGTGKSVLAVNLVGDFMREDINAQHATGSKAFTQTIWEILGSRSKAQFRYFNNYTDASSGEIDVLVCDEAHRIRKSSNTRFTPAKKRSTKPQIEELIAAAKTSVFFIDDQQVVRPDEAGSIAHIDEHAQRLGCEITTFELEVQFRCGGSDGFVNWVDNTIGIRRTANVLWSGDENFDFRIVPSVEDLDTAIRARAAEGASARLVAGYCWPWSHPDRSGKLSADVVIGAWRRPWNARPDAGRLAPGIPPAPLWAHDPGGMGQVGCVYTAQGFEFEYVGVIWGPDLVYRFDKNGWLGEKTRSHDGSVKRSGDRFADLVKNTYRVLLSRGLKGCYVYFMDKETESFFRSRMENQSKASPRQDSAPHDSVERVMLNQLNTARTSQVLPLPVVASPEVEPYVNAVPIVNLKFAAGAFSDVQTIDDEGLEWVKLPDHFRPQPGLFVAQVIGESMNRRIPNGSWCLFKLNPGGTRQGKIVVAQHRSLRDPDLGGSFTVKVYRSEKESSPDGSQLNSRVILSPDSEDPRFQPIVIEEPQEEEVRVVAEFIAVMD